MPPRKHPSATNINGLVKLPPINEKPVTKKGQRLSRSQSRILRRGLDADGFRNAIKSRKASQLRAAVNESRAQGLLGGKRYRKTAKRRRAKKSCGWFW